MLIIDTVAFCLNVVLLFVHALRCTSGDDYIFSDNSDPLKENSWIFPQFSAGKIKKTTKKR